MTRRPELDKHLEGTAYSVPHHPDLDTLEEAGLGFGKRDEWDRDWMWYKGGTSEPIKLPAPRKRTRERGFQRPNGLGRDC